MMRLLPIFLCAALASACTPQQPNTSGSGGQAPAANQRTPQAFWQSRQQNLLALSQWDLNGRVSLTVSGRNWSFGLAWNQFQDGRYLMTIKNPLTGAEMARVKQSGNQVVLTTNQGQTFRDTNAERLLANRLGMRLPLGHLRYWAQGIAVPNVPVSHVNLDSNGRPKTLMQAGWQIDYSTYQQPGALAMPTKLSLQNLSAGVKAKMVVKQWQVRR